MAGLVQEGVEGSCTRALLRSGLQERSSGALPPPATPPQGQVTEQLPLLLADCCLCRYGWVSPMTGRPLRELPVHSITVRQMLDEVADVLQCLAATGAPPPPPPAAAGGAGTSAPPPPLRPPPGFPAAALQHPPPLAPYGAPATPLASGGAMPPPPLPPHMWR